MVEYMLRDYQLNAHAELKSYLDKYNYSYLSLPTGAGKTYTAISYILKHSVFGSKTVWLAHRLNLIAQASEEAKRQGLYNFIGMTWHKAKDLNIKIDVEYLVVDEIHWGGSMNKIIAQRKAIIRAIKNIAPKKIIFMSATLLNIDDKAFGKVVKNENTSHYSTTQAINDGYILMPSIINIDEYNDKIFLEKSISKIRHKAIFISSSIADANRFYSLYMKQFFPSFKFKASVYHSNVKRKEEILEKFKNNELDILFSVGSLREGADFPTLDTLIVTSLNVSNIRNTHQMIGRLTRIAEGKKKANFIYRESHSSKKSSIKFKYEDIKIQSNVTLNDKYFDKLTEDVKRNVVFSILLQNSDRVRLPRIEMIDENSVCLVYESSSQIYSIKDVIKKVRAVILDDMEFFKAKALEGGERPRSIKLKNLLKRVRSKPEYPEFYKFIQVHAPHWLKVSSHVKSDAIKRQIKNAVLNNDLEYLSEKIVKTRVRRYLKEHSLGYDEEMAKFIRENNKDYYDTMIVTQNNKVNRKTEEIKNELMNLAMKKKPRSSLDKQAINCLLRYTKPRSSRYDRDFAVKIYQLAPQWFQHLSVNELLSQNLPIN